MSVFIQRSSNLRSVTFVSKWCLSNPQSRYQLSAFSTSESKIPNHNTNNNKNIEDDGLGTANSRQTPSAPSSSSIFQTVLEKVQGKRQPGTLILVRHGETDWNHRELFTGWVDVDLSERGIREVEHAARLLLERGYTADITYTSMLKRAIRSSWIILNEINQIYRPIIKTWRLNERMYGALEGHSKPGLAKLFGEETVQLWRGAGLSDRPPAMLENHLYWHGRERKYADLSSSLIPRTESLQDCIDRTIPLWISHILPDLQAGRNVMIVAHRNSLRGLIRHIDGLTTKDVQRLAIPNGIPLVYKFDYNMKPLPHRNAQAPLSGIWLEKKVN
jgi:2,3-bisphosphoglycerate-dependent phosphoglycerate mutase